MTVLLDDHLLRDWLTLRDHALVDEVAHDRVATTNLWYARLCKTAGRPGAGAFLRGWTAAERSTLAANLMTLPPEVEIAPMRSLAWQMGTLVSSRSGLSMLGAEAVAAALEHGHRILVSARDDGPGIRRCCSDLGISYRTLAR